MYASTAKRARKKTMVTRQRTIVLKSYQNWAEPPAAADQKRPSAILKKSLTKGPR